MRNALVLALACTIAAACGPVDSTTPTSSAAALSLPDITPLPIRLGEKTTAWTGSIVDLLAADAWAECSWRDATTPIDQDTPDKRYADPYLKNLWALMADAKCGSYKNGPTGWFKQRNDTACNIDASNGGPAKAALTAASIREGIAGAGPANAFASLNVEYAAINLCIAQRMRDFVPGAAGGEALLLSAADQVQLLETVRERAQAAMLHYAALGVAFATAVTPPPPGWTGPTSQNHVVTMIAWAQQPAQAEILRGMGADFATSVNTFVTVSRELVELLHRSASARKPRGGSPGSPTDDAWGAGSFRQRMLAALYGGDPLVMDATGPWIHTPPEAAPGYTTGLGPIADIHPVDWPSNNELPYQDQEVLSPQPWTLDSLARRFDRLDLVTASPVTTTPTSFCVPIDESFSASRMYRAVEADIRTSDCEATSGGTCATVAPDDVPDPGADYTSYQLWKKHRIAPTDAQTLVHFWAKAVGQYCYSSRFGFFYGTYDRRGTANLDGVLDARAVGTRTAYHVSPQTRLYGKSIAQVAPRFAALWSLYLPKKVDPYGTNATQRLNPLYFDDADLRRGGIVPALNGVRAAILDAADTFAALPPVARPGVINYFASAGTILNTIDGAVGSTATNTTPVVQSVAAPSGRIVEQVVTGGEPRWTTDVLVPADDSWFLGGRIRLVAIPMHPGASNLVLSPKTTLLVGPSGPMTLSALLASPDVRRSALLIAPTRGPTTGLRQNLVTWRFELGLPKDVTEWTLALERVGDTNDYRLLLGSFRAFPSTGGQKHWGTYLSSGGAFNRTAEQAMAVLEKNAAVPAFDAFGFRTDWVPPTDAALVGGRSTDDAMVLYVDHARSAAGDATSAVRTAFDNLLQEKGDAAALQAAAVKSTEVAKIEQRSLCGEAAGAGKSCVVAAGEPVPICCAASKTAKTPIATPVGPFKTACDATSPMTAKKRLDCMAVALFAILDFQPELGLPVFGARDAAVQPSFDAFKGGSLQSIYIEQWAALRNAVLAGSELSAAVEAAKARVAAAEATLAAASLKVAQNCSPQAMAEAVFAGMGVSVGGGVTGPSASVSFSPGPLIAQRQKCSDLKVELGPTKANTLSAFLDALSNVGTQASRLSDNARRLQEASARGLKTAADAQLATDRAALEAQLTGFGLKTSFGLYRRVTSFDAWRAKALLENARRFGLTARRAIEARYVVDLRLLAGTEPFVTGPSSWADEVYDYDLNMPASVGLAVGKADTPGIYPNRVLDYVGNLDRFVKGYAVARPSAVAQRDTEIATLPGALGASSPVGLPEGTIDAGASKWMFLCPGGWVGLDTATSADSVCAGSRPSRARLSFQLDPWGRVDGSIAREPFTRRYNARFQRLVVNLVGTGVLDCRLASDPLTCYSQPFVRYDMTQVGPAWVTNYEQEWRALAFGATRIEGAKALAAERFLDPIAESFSKPYVDATTRSELANRPLGGAYLVELEVGPEVRLDRIERVQLLLESTYWAKAL